MQHDIYHFLRKIEGEFKELPPNSLTPKTALIHLIDWNSLNILLFLAFLSSEYGIKATYEEIKPLNNLEELYQYLLQKKV